MACYNEFITIGKYMDALIGFTGFVGSNLLMQGNYTELFNSENFEKLKCQTFNRVTCCGISAEKWKANQDPENDLRKINKLKDVLETIKCNEFILISTIDVYPERSNLNEEFDPTGHANNPYGLHRLEFENFIKKKFEKTYIIRLPALFGKGLKKNVIFDLLNDNCLENINIDSSFQYYYLKNIQYDIDIAIKNNLYSVNLFTEPIETRTIVEEFFPQKRLLSKPDLAIHYNLKTKFDSIYGGERGYIRSRKQVLLDLEDFITIYRKGKD